MATIAVQHIGFHGHVGPAARIGEVLARQGHRVVSWAPDPFKELVLATGSEFRPHDPIDLRGELQSSQSLTAALAEYTAERGGEIIEELYDLGADLILHDLYALWARVAGDFLGVPRIVSNAVFPGTDLVLPPFHPLAPSVAADPRRMGEILAAIDRVRRAQTTIAQTWGIDIGSWPEALVSRAGITLLPTTEAITGMPPPADGWFYIGPLGRETPARAPAGARPLVYVSLGTFFNFAWGAYETLIQALAGEPIDAVLTTGAGPISPAALDGLAANVTVTAFVDDVPGLLARCDAFVTHAGTASVHEALLAGVPMVCLPQGPDQTYWARRMVELGVGLQPGTDASSIRAALREVLNDRCWRARAGEVGQSLAAFDGEARITELVTRTLGQRAVRDRLS